MYANNKASAWQIVSLIYIKYMCVTNIKKHHAAQNISFILLLIVFRTKLSIAIWLGFFLTFKGS